jgi:endonuclease V-like protein UPF0215 family
VGAPCAQSGVRRALALLFHDPMLPWALAMNVLGFDDGPFERDHRGDVLLVGVVCAGTRLDGVVSGRVRRDGADATRKMIELVRGSQFAAHVRAVMLQGIAVAGFNVVDIHELSAVLGMPVLVVTRRPPDMSAVRRALFSDVPRRRPRVPGAARKWALIERAGIVEPLGTSRRAMRRGPTGLRGGDQRLWIQRAGLSIDAARRLVGDTTLHGNVPEPLRLAHLIAGGIVTGRSRGRA